MRHTDKSNDLSGEERPRRAADPLVVYEEAKAAIHCAGNGTPEDVPLSDGWADELACVDLMHRVWPDGGHRSMPATASPDKVLGDFRFIREIGRGGMGVVYEAEQISMGRRVALKVLPFAALIDDRTLQRFRNEVRAAAALDHAHIVPIYSVGEDRGTHYYTMQLVRGQTLAELVEQVRKQQDARCSMLDAGSNPASKIQHPASSIDTRPIAALSTRDTANPRAYFCHIARLGIQAAEALQHAHDLGVLHRDVKPSNLLLDREGKLYVTDFGLARIGTDAGMTMTGDIVGTLRYMAPEQALGKRVIIDHRADIYSLGATLYELLVLRPAFSELERAELLKQIAFEEPRPLRKIDRHIPAELETIVLKAMAKNRDERYPTAQLLADDLLAFLDNRQIMARPATAFDRAVKWSRRHSALVTVFIASIAMVALVATVAGSLLAVAFRNEQQQRQLAEERLTYSQRSTYNLQLAQVRDVWQYDPLRAQQLLEDPECCPPEFRDFTWRLYRRLCQHDQLTLRGDEVPKTSAVYLAKHHLVASADVEGVIGIWNADTGANVARIAAHSNIITSLKASADESLLASASRDGTVRLWTVEGVGANPPVKEKFVLAGGEGPVMDVAFAPDGKTLAGGATAETIHLWDTGSGEEYKLRRGPLHSRDQRIISVSYSPSGNFLAAGSENSSVWIWGPKHGRPIASIESDSPASFLPLAFAPDESILAVGGRSITLWNWRAGTKSGSLPAHMGHDVSGIDFSSDGKQLLSAGFDGQLRIWDVSALKQQFCLSGHRDRLRSLHYSHSAGVATTASHDGTIKLWKLDSALEERTLQVDTESVSTVAFCPRTHSFVSAGKQSVAQLWNAEDGQELGQFVGHDDQVEGAAFSPLGDLLATAGRDLTVRLWNPKTFQELGRLAGHTDRIGILAFSSDGRQLASAGHDQNIRLWDVQSQQLVRELVGHSHDVWALAYSPSGGQLVSTSRDGTIRFWDPDTGKPLNLCREPDGEGVGCCAFSPDGRTLATATSRLSDQGQHSGNIHLWDTETLRIRRELHGHTDEVYYIAFSPDGRTLVSSGRDRAIRLWDPITGQERGSLPGHTGRVYCVTYSSDGRYLASAGQHGEVKIWNGVTSDEPVLPSLQSQNRRQDESFKTLEFDAASVEAFDVHPSRKLLATIASDGMVRIWEIPTGACILSLRSEGRLLQSIDWSFDGASVLTGDNDGNVRQWNAKSGEMMMQTFAGETSTYAALAHSGRLIALSQPDFKKVGSNGAIAVYAIGTTEPQWQVYCPTNGPPVFSSNNDSVVTADRLNNLTSSIRWRSAATGEQIAELPPYLGKIASFCFSPDEQLLVLAGTDSDRPIEVWDVATRERRYTLRGHTKEVNRVAVSPDGRYVASGSADTTIRLWELSSGRLLKVFRGHTSRFRALRFTADSTLLVSGSDHTIKLWDIAVVK